MTLRIRYREVECGISVGAVETEVRSVEIKEGVLRAVETKVRSVEQKVSNSKGQ